MTPTRCRFMPNIEQLQKRRIRIRNLVIQIIMVLAFALVVLFVIEKLILPVMVNTSISVEHGEQVSSGVGLAFTALEELEMPLDLQVFVSKPINRPYLELAIRLSEMSVDRLRAVAEGLLEITY